MRRLRMLVGWGLFGLFLSIANLVAALEISGLEVPLLDGAISRQQARRGSENARMAVYSINQPLAQVVSFYQAYLNDNNFLVIGAQDNGVYNVSVKKGDVMFIIRVYSENNQTILQFIW